MDQYQIATATSIILLNKQKNFINSEMGPNFAGFTVFEKQTRSFRQ